MAAPTGGYKLLLLCQTTCRAAGEVLLHYSYAILISSLNFMSTKHSAGRSA